MRCPEAPERDTAAGDDKDKKDDKKDDKDEQDDKDAKKSGSAAKPDDKDKE